MIEPVYGDTAMFTAMAYGQADPLTMQWCQQRVEATRQQLAPEAQTYFHNAMGTVYADIDYQHIARLSKALIGRADGLWLNDTVQTLVEISHIQNAPPVMMDWIMAHPTIREKYHKQEIAGYDEHYYDPYPDEHSEDFFKYREAINGVYLEDPETGDYKSTYWFNDFDDSVLDFSDQISIIETWNNVLAYLKAGKDDPTSTYGAML